MATLRFASTQIELLDGRAIEHLSDAMLTAANTRGLLASGHAGALRLAGGGDIERELQAQAPLLVGSAYVTGSGRLSARGVNRIAHAVVNSQPGEPPRRAAVERALAAALTLLDQAGSRSLTTPEIGLRIAGIAVGDAAAIMADVLIACLRRGAGFDVVRIASLEPDYLRACGAEIQLRGGVGG
jgi:O-acetyl-ADP-ribose deacetylase (regulator of RNase III)